MSTAEPRSPTGRDDDVTAEGRSDSSDGLDAHPSPDEPTRGDPCSCALGQDRRNAAHDRERRDLGRPTPRTEAAGRIHAHRRSLGARPGGERVLHLRGADRRPGRRTRTRRARDARGSREHGKQPTSSESGPGFYEGWIYVYDDGRVLSYPDSGPISERRLKSARPGPRSPRGARPAGPPALPEHHRGAAGGVVRPHPRRISARPVRCAATSTWTRLPRRAMSRATRGRSGITSPRTSQALLSAGGRWRPSPTTSWMRTATSSGPRASTASRAPASVCVVLSPAQARAFWAFMRAPEGSREEDGELLVSDTTFAELQGGRRTEPRVLVHTDPAPRRLGALGRLTIAGQITMNLAETTIQPIPPRITAQSTAAPHPKANCRRSRGTDIAVATAATPTASARSVPDVAACRRSSGPQYDPPAIAGQITGAGTRARTGRCRPRPRSRPGGGSTGSPRPACRDASDRMRPRHVP